jgi:hypothetical protein
VGDALLERLVELAGFAQAVHVRRHERADGLERLEIRKANLGEVAADADLRDLLAFLAE